MASYTLNQAECRVLVISAEWQHSWEEYAAWHLGLTEGAADETKARHAFVYGDFRRVHRTGIIAVHYRAAEWRHKAIELAAHELLQILDKKAGIPPLTAEALSGSRLCRPPRSRSRGAGGSRGAGRRSSSHSGRR